MRVVAGVGRVAVLPLLSDASRRVPNAGRKVDEPDAVSPAAGDESVAVDLERNGNGGNIDLIPVRTAIIREVDDVGVADEHPPHRVEGDRARVWKRCVNKA